MTLRLCFILLAVVACSAALTAASPTFSVVTSPSYVETDASSQGVSMTHADVAEVLCGSFGLNTDTTFSKVAKTSPFETPAAGLIVELKGNCDSCLPSNVEATFDVVEGSATETLEDITTRFTAAFGSNAIHTCTNDVSQELTPLSKVPGIDAAGNAVIVEGDMAIVSPNAAFFPHLAALVSDVDALVAKQGPATIVVSVDVSNMNPGAAMVMKAVLAYAADTLSKATNGNALVTVHTYIAPSSVYRRSEGTSASYGASGDIRFVPNNANLTARDYAWVEYCSEYKCFCNLDREGNPWDPDTRCSTTCTDSKTVCDDCVWLGCACNSTSVMRSQSQCIKCAAGYVAINNHCYLDSEMVVPVNISLWLGLALLLGFIATCGALGYMDPGYDSIIYRMTQQRIKSH